MAGRRRWQPSRPLRALTPSTSLTNEIEQGPVRGDAQGEMRGWGKCEDRHYWCKSVSNCGRTARRQGAAEGFRVHPLKPQSPWSYESKYHETHSIERTLVSKPPIERSSKRTLRAAGGQILAALQFCAAAENEKGGDNVGGGVAGAKDGGVAFMVCMCALQQHANGGIQCGRQSLM